MPITADFHTHTHHSGDSDAKMKDMIESALSKGLTHLCFTDHQDFDYPTTHEPAGMFDLNVDAYRKEFLLYKEEYAERIQLHFGVELGMQEVCAQKNKDFVAMHDFDFVIGSVHVARGEDPFHPDYYDHCADRLRNAGASPTNAEIEREAMRFYLEAMYDTLQVFDGFDVLGHLDLVDRYYPSGNMTYPHDDHKEIIDAILQWLVKKEKGLDCNTRLLQKGAGEMNPTKKILARFYELGGRVITFGSDAHTPEYVAGEFAQAATIAKEAGFTEYCTFEKRRAAFHPL